MATYVLNSVGTALGGPLGGLVGSVIGGFIDQALFGPGDMEGPRLSDLSVTTSTYGAPIPLVYGPENRVSGNIIWSTDLVEHKEEQGGKGGGPSYTTYTYSVSLAVAINGRKSARLKRIFANGKVIYNADKAPSSGSGALPPVSDTEGQIVTKTYFDQAVADAMEAEAYAADSDANPFGVYGAIFWGLYGNPYKSRGTHSVFDELHFYNGSAVQEPDPFIESHEGVGEVPGYRHTTYVVIKDLFLTDFGNRIPNFEFELVADEDIIAGEIVKDMMERAVIGEYSVFGLTDFVRGYAIGRQVPVYQAIMPLGLTYDFEATDQAGVMAFVRKSRGMKATVPYGQMGAKDGRSITPAQSPYELKNISAVYMPDQVSVTFRDPEMDYQVNTQTAFRSMGSATNKINQELNVVLDVDKARKVADRLLWGAWSNKKLGNFSLSDTWLRYHPGDILGIPALGDVLPMKIVRKSRGANGVIQIEAQYEDPEIYNSQATGVNGLPINQDVRISGGTVLGLLDAPLLYDTDTSDGFYWTVSGEDIAWRGATLFRSADGSVTYNRVTDTNFNNPIGDITGVLGAGQAEVWDELNTLTVTFPSGLSTLESKSEERVLNGENAAWVGPAGGGAGEVIQFRTATLIGSNQYTLSGLLRGRLGTEHKMTSHAADEIFVLLRKDTVHDSSFGISDWDKERYYKGVSFLNDPGITEAQAFTNTGIRAKPLSPVHVKGVRDGSNNLAITWIRRTRLRTPGLGGGEVPLGETTEAYEIDIYSGSTVVRTITATSEAASYTAAQQSSDGLTPGDLVIMKIYQLSETKGRGYAAEATI